MTLLRLTRRDWLRRASAAAAAGAAALRCGLARILEEPPRWRECPFSELAGLITPTPRFFLRSHLEYPELDRSKWKLEIGGAVRRPLALGTGDLEALPAVERTITFECAGNPPGGGMVSTAHWRGARLRALLDRAGVAAGAKEVVFEGADYGLDEVESVPLVYARSIPLEKALAEETLIAWEMNGAPLDREHGAPARLVVAGYYAMSHVKWLARIRVVERPYAGFYMTKRYFTARRLPGTGDLQVRPEMKLKVKSQIARPVERERVFGDPVLISGAAWTGEGEISRVEVSTDGGRAWEPARLLDGPAPYAWVRWQHPWRPARSGPHTLVCRAFDSRGGEQPEAADPAVINRYGNNWYHRVEVTAGNP